MKCAFCVAQGKRSIIKEKKEKRRDEGRYNESIEPYYDEDGVYHNHSNYYRKICWICGNGHEWTVEHYRALECCRKPAREEMDPYVLTGCMIGRGPIDQQVKDKFLLLGCSYPAGPLAVVKKPGTKFVSDTDNQYHAERIADGNPDDVKEMKEQLHQVGISISDPWKIGVWKMTLCSDMYPELIVDGKIIYDATAPSLVWTCEATGAKLYVGDRADAINSPLCKTLGITACMTIAGRDIDEDRQASFLHYEFHRLEDDPDDADELEFMTREWTNPWIKKMLTKEGVSLLIHCEEGRSRAPTVAAAFLCDHLKIRGEEALDMVRKARHITNPNKGFVQWLTNKQSTK